MTARRRPAWAPLRVVAIVASAALLSVGALAIVPTSTVEAAERAEWHDFDDDGFADLAIGVPGEIVGGVDNAGAVHVLYGSSRGLGATRDRFFHQGNLPFVFGVVGPEAGDRFGSALASGDFDGDGFADLAIGVPGEDLEGPDGEVVGPDYGLVQLLWGSDSGLAPNTGSLGHGAQGGTFGGRFGASLAALDIADAESSSSTVGDGIADLAIGGEKMQVIIGVGGVRDFLPGPSHRFVVPGFGPTSSKLVLAGGQLDSDAIDELLIGLPLADTAPDGVRVVDAGGIVEVQREDLGSGPTGLQALFQEDFFGPGTSEAGDRFGSAIVIGQIVGAASSREEVVIGVPGEDFAFNGSQVVDAGRAVFIHPFGASLLSEAPADVPDVPEPGDQFGASLALGSFDDGPGLDLAVGVPGEQVGSTDGAGAVILFLDDQTRRILHQNSSLVAGNAAANDRFGSVLSAAGFGKSDRMDLAVGVPQDNEPGGVSNSGVVNVFYGAASGPTGSNDQFWHQAVSGIPNAPNPGDRFGDALR